MSQAAVQPPKLGETKVTILNPTDFDSREAWEEAEEFERAYLFHGNAMMEAVREYADVVGYENPDRAWILSPYDTWEANPHYHGPRVEHPESQS